jgi:hypothetical protein
MKVCFYHSNIITASYLRRVISRSINVSTQLRILPLLVIRVQNSINIPKRDDENITPCSLVGMYQPSRRTCYYRLRGKRGRKADKERGNLYRKYCISFSVTAKLRLSHTSDTEFRIQVSRAKVSRSFRRYASCQTGKILSPTFRFNPYF